MAQKEQVDLETESYFITEYQLEQYKRRHLYETPEQIIKKSIQGTVGAVAVDRRGNLAAGTSTGGTTNCLPGRIGDSCVIGAGCYANNKTCAVSGTGEGEFIIRGVIAHTISMLVEQGMGLQEACDHVLFSRQEVKGEIGVIAVNPAGDIGIALTTKAMRRAWIGIDGILNIAIRK